MNAPVLVVLGLAVLGTGLLIHFAPQLRLIDRPHERSSHDVPTPRGGGTALVAAVLAGLLALAAFDIAWATNLFNFIDGIDGIAATEGLFVAVVAAALLAAQAPPVAAALAVIAATCAGFLVWNWAPAHIFMGNVGSGSFGFLRAAVAVLTAPQGPLALLRGLMALAYQAGAGTPH